MNIFIIQNKIIMKKIFILSLISFAIIVSSSVFADNVKDEKAQSSAVKKSKEMKSQLGLTIEQQKQVQDILYVGFAETRSVYTQEDLSKEQKISRYNEISSQTQEGIQKVLTPEQFKKYLNVGRGE